MARPVMGPGDPVGPDRSPLWPVDGPVAGTAGTSDGDGGAESGRGRHAVPGRRASRRRQREAGRAWRIGRGVLEVAAVVAVALVLSLLVRIFLVQAYYVPTSAMVDTLRPGERILASHVTTRLSGVARGEIIVFPDPGGWRDDPPPSRGDWSASVGDALAFLGLVPDQGEREVVMRAIAVGGDRIACCSEEGRILLNGVPLIEPYLRPGVPTNQVIFDVVVPEGRVFVMGDDRGSSWDSRYHLDVESGTVAVDDVAGRAVLILWPPGRIEPLRIPSVYGQVSEPGAR